MKTLFNEVKTLPFSVFNNRLSLAQMVILIVALLGGIAGSMYLCDPTSFNRFK